MTGNIIQIRGTYNLSVDDYILVGNNIRYLVVETFSDRVTVVRIYPWYIRFWNLIRDFKKK